MKIELSSSAVNKPRVCIDLENPPENLEEIVQDYFADYTSGTNPDFLDSDKLSYIDLIRKKIHPEQDSYEAVKKKLLDWFEYQLDESERVPDISECWSVEFFEECYGDGDKKLYDKKYGYKEMNHHQYNKVHHTLIRIISAVINYDRVDHITNRRERMTDELKPVRCGCGGEAKIDAYLGDLHRSNLYYIYCAKCDIRTSNYLSEAEAVMAWNKAMGAEIILPDHICQLCDCYDKQRCYCNLHGIWIPSDFYCKSWEPEGIEEDEDA